MMPAQDLRALGRAVREVRKRLGLRQEDLARILNCPKSWLGKLEAGTIWKVDQIKRWDRIETIRRWLREQEEGGHA